MSTKVVTAPAGHAKRPVRSDKPAKQAEQQPAVNEDEARLAKDDSEQEVSVAPANAEETASVESETSMAGDFTFGSALAEAAAASGSLISDAQRADEVGFGAFGDGDGSTPLLLAAIGLAAVGLIFLVKDGGDGDDAVVPVNRPPTITAPAAATTAEDTVLQIAAPVTSDPDAGDVVTVTATVPAAQGTIVKNANGSFTFTPAPNFNGTATITYSATDGKVTTPVTVTQTITVTPVNDAPTITVPTVAAINEDSAGVTFTVATADPDAGATVTTTATVPAAQGTVTKNADGTFTFVPAANFNGTATITLSATDGVVTTPTTATLNITVNPVNDPAVLSPLTVNAAGGVSTNLSDLLTITDIDGPADQVTVSVSTQPQNGTISIVNGDVIYTPTAGYSGPDSIAFTLVDAGTPGSATATYTVAINVTPSGPVITTQSIDVGTANVAANRDAGTANFNFTDDAKATTNVNITNFTNNDKITVTNAVSSDYNFGRSFEDINDLVITYTDADTGATNRIVIQDILPDTGAATSLAAVNQLLGFTFMTFA